MALENLAACERRVSSQNGEDGVIAAIFDTIGTTNRYFVEFGCEAATECNAANLLTQGWNGLLMDPFHDSQNPLAVIRREFVTAENVGHLFQKYQVPAQFDLLSLDIDSNDFWVWRQIQHRARLVVIEYNAHVSPLLARTIAYDIHYQWGGTDYFGASLLALVELGRRKHYTLVYCESSGANAFFVANEALPAGFEPPSVLDLYRAPNYLNKGHSFARDTQRTMIDPFW